MDQDYNENLLTKNSIYASEENLKEAAMQLYEKWKKLGVTSSIVRIIGWTTLVITAIISFCFFRQNKTWIGSVFYAALFVAFGVVVIGVVVLLLKPLFAAQRKKAIEVHEQLARIEEQLMFHELNAVVDMLPHQVVIDDSFVEDGESAETATLEGADIQAIYDGGFQIRALQMEKARWGEWCWVVSAGLAIVLVIALIVAWFVFCILLVGVVLFAIITRGTDNTPAYHQHNAIETGDENISWMDIITEEFHGRFSKICDAISGKKETVRRCLAIREIVCNDLQEKGAISFRPYKLGYWPRHSKWDAVP